jgi:hypothetical protein
MSTPETSDSESNDESNDITGVSRAALQELATAVGAINCSHNVSGGINRYVIRDPDFVIEYYVDANTGLEMVTVESRHPDHIWTFSHSAPAKDWKISQVVDDHNLLTELYADSIGTSQHARFSFRGPPAERELGEIEFCDEVSEEDASDMLIDEEHLSG